MSLTQLKEKPTNLIYVDEAIKYNQRIKKFNINQTTLIRSISSLLSIKDFRNGNGNSKNHLNNMLIDFFNFNNEFYISKQALSVFEKHQPFHNFTFNEEILNNIKSLYKGYLIPIENISNELLARHLDHTKIFKLLINLKNRIILLKKEKQLINNLPNNQISFLNENKNLEKIIKIKLSPHKIKLVKNKKKIFKNN